MAKKYNRIESIKKWCKGYDLDQMLEEISVSSCDEMKDNFKKGEKMYKLNELLSGWYAVVDTDGINSYHSTEAEALKERLDIINRVMNG